MEKLFKNNIQNKPLMEFTDLIQIMIAIHLGKMKFSCRRQFFSGFTVLKMSNLVTCETCFHKFQPCFGEKIIHTPYMDAGSFVLSVNTKDRDNDLENLNDLFDFSNLNTNHELFSSTQNFLVGGIHLFAE